MIELEISLNDNSKITVEVDEYNPQDLAEKLNDNQKNVIVIGDAILQRYSIIRIMPVKGVADGE